MQTALKTQKNNQNYNGLTAADLLALLAEKDQLLEEKNELLQAHQQHLDDKDHVIDEQAKRIRLLEEYLRLAKVQKFSSSSEKLPFQSHLFDEAELEVALSEFEQQLPEEDRVRPRNKTRSRGFSENLPRQQVQLCLSEEEKAGAVKTFFSKVKEELDFIPALVQVREYWQEKAVFDQDGNEVIVAAKATRPPPGQVFCQCLPAGPYRRLQIRRWPAPVSTGRYVQALRWRHQPLQHGQLDSKTA